MVSDLVRALTFKGGVWRKDWHRNERKVRSVKLSQKESEGVTKSLHESVGVTLSHEGLKESGRRVN